MKNMIRIAARAVLVSVLATIGFMAAPARAGETITYFHNDAAGSPVLATDANGLIAWTETYRPYGNQLIDSAASANNKLWFAGKPYDNGTGLTYMGARYYDPSIGRFMGVDPAPIDFENLHSFNRYAYANNNPNRYVDPDGHSPLDVAFLVYDVGKLGVALYTGVGVQGALLDVASSVVGVASPIPGVGQALKAARGGAAMVSKGADGVRVAKEFLEQGGMKKVADEVTVATANGRTKLDSLMKDGDKNIGVEVKTGPTAKLTGNQRKRHGEINGGDENGLVGRKAKDAGELGESVDHVVVIHVDDQLEVTRAYCVVGRGSGC